MTKSNKKKSEFLGMSHGAACGQLRKRIMFSMAQELGRDICYRCGKRIKSVNELSVEHKKPWLGESTELFWDLGNIAFSHLSCNIRHQRKPHKIISPDDMEWCWECKQFKPISEFPSEEGRYESGIRKPCSKCGVERNRDYRERKYEECGSGWRKS